MNMLDQFNAMHMSTAMNLAGINFIEEPQGPSVEALKQIALLSGYQERRSQLIMAATIERCFKEGLSTAIEAPTGTGKSLGYLTPVALHGEVTIIATSNKELQRQIFKKDVPFVQGNVKQFTAALLKGKANFLCLKRLQEYKKTECSADTSELEDDLIAGDFESLSYQSPLQTEINGDDGCTRKKCPHYAACYYYEHKRKAEGAQVIVTNNAMLMADIQSGGRSLPDYKYLILDEAHNLEKNAQEALTTEVTLNSVLSLLNRKLVKDVIDPREREIIEDSARDLFNFDYENEKNVFVKTIIKGLKLSKLIDDLSVELNKHFLRDDEYEDLAERASNLAFNLKTVCEVNDKNVHYVEKKFEKFKIICVPLDVSHILKSRLFSERVVVATSATLSTKEGFNFFTKRVGMETQIQPKSLPTPFDYKRNALLYIPRDIMPPTSAHFAEERAHIQHQNKMAARMQELVMLSEGRAFLLFTSNKMMHAVSERLKVPYQVLKQGDLPKGEIIKRFKSEPSVLLGVDTFWEGVDVSGDALSLVAIDKPPFKPPHDPIYGGIIRQIGENAAWYGYSLPSGIIKVKQGVGRLIRTDTDRGVMCILDGRLHKGYGSKVIGSLPPAPLTTNIEDVEKFFR